MKKNVMSEGWESLTWELSDFPAVMRELVSDGNIDGLKLKLESDILKLEVKRVNSSVKTVLFEVRDTEYGLVENMIIPEFLADSGYNIKKTMFLLEEIEMFSLKLNVSWREVSLFASAYFKEIMESNGKKGWSCAEFFGVMEFAIVMQRNLSSFIKTSSLLHDNWKMLIVLFVASFKNSPTLAVGLLQDVRVFLEEQNMTIGDFNKILKIQSSHILDFKFEDIHAILDFAELVGSDLWNDLTLYKIYQNSLLKSQANTENSLMEFIVGVKSLDINIPEFRIILSSQFRQWKNPNFKELTYLLQFLSVVQGSFLQGDQFLFKAFVNSIERDGNDGFTMKTFKKLVAKLKKLPLNYWDFYDLTEQYFYKMNPSSIPNCDILLSDFELLLKFKEILNGYGIDLLSKKYSGAGKSPLKGIFRAFVRCAQDSKFEEAIRQLQQLFEKIINLTWEANLENDSFNGSVFEEKLSKFGNVLNFHFRDLDREGHAELDALSEFDSVREDFLRMSFLTIDFIDIEGAFCFLKTLGSQFSRCRGLLGVFLEEYKNCAQKALELLDELPITLEENNLNCYSLEMLLEIHEVASFEEIHLLILFGGTMSVTLRKSSGLFKLIKREFRLEQSSLLGLPKMEYLLLQLKEWLEFSDVTEKDFSFYLNYYYASKIDSWEELDCLISFVELLGEQEEGFPELFSVFKNRYCLKASEAETQLNELLKIEQVEKLEEIARVYESFDFAEIQDCLLLEFNSF